jgi:4-hydroxybenzoyl-CoA thioesterase/acyl-CoA thioester hydrolase
MQVVVTDVSLKYHSPAILDDQISVTAVLSKASRVTFQMTQQVFRGDELLVEGWVKVACVNSTTKRPQGMPKPMFNALSDSFNQEL